MSNVFKPSPIVEAAYAPIFSRGSSVSVRKGIFFVTMPSLSRRLLIPAEKSIFFRCAGCWPSSKWQKRVFCKKLILPGDTFPNNLFCPVRVKVMENTLKGRYTSEINNLNKDNWRPAEAKNVKDQNNSLSWGTGLKEAPLHKDWVVQQSYPSIPT